MNFDAVEALDAQFEDKAESVACYIKNLSAFAADLKAEEENLSARRKTVEHRVDSVKKYLSSCLVTVGKDKVETAKARIRPCLKNKSCTRNQVMRSYEHETI